MMNDDDFDFEALRTVLDRDQMTQLWSKAEVAKIMMEHAARLMEEVKNDIKFYSMVGKIENE